MNRQPSLSGPLGPARSAPQDAGRLTGEDRAGAVARTYARGTRRLQLTESQLRYIARQERSRQELTRPSAAR
ncbi:MAG: hypothetical protein ACTHOD_19010 [Motilibacteraceae bacterium]